MISHLHVSFAMISGHEILLSYIKTVELSHFVCGTFSTRDVDPKIKQIKQMNSTPHYAEFQTV